MLDFVSRSNGRHQRTLVAMVLVLLVALSATLVLSGCGEKTVVEKEEKKETNGKVENGEKKETDGEQNGEEVELGSEYTNEMYGYSLSYPESWELKEILGGHGCQINNPDNDEWEVLAWGDPDMGKTPEEWLEEQYTMISSFFDTERDPSTLTSGSFDGSDYAYDYWTQFVPVGEYYRYYDIMIVEQGGSIYFVTAEYPMDETEEASPIMMGIMDSLVLPTGDTGE